MTEHKDFEIISNSDSAMDDKNEIENNDDEVIDDNIYSQNDHSFMFDLYRENRQLLDKISEQEILITKLQERSCYLVNSNVFWLCCYLSTTVITTLFSLTYH